MLAAFIGVTGALVFGSADFAGGRAAKRTRAVRNSAIGPMSTLSPLTVEISAVVPVLGGVVRGGRLIVVGFAAIVVAVVAIMGLAAVTAVEPVRFVPVRFVPVGFVHEKGAVRPPLGAVAMAIPSAGGRTC